MGAQGPDHLTFDLADSSKLSLSFYGKKPGPGMKLEKLSLQFALHDTGQDADVLEAYERLIHDAMVGDHTLFNTAEGIERLWEVATPLLEHPPTGAALRQGQLGPARHQRPRRTSDLAAPLRAPLARLLLRLSGLSAGVGHELRHRVGGGAHRDLFAEGVTVASRRLDRTVATPARHAGAEPVVARELLPGRTASPFPVFTDAQDPTIDAPDRNEWRTRCRPAPIRTRRSSKGDDMPKLIITHSVVDVDDLLKGKSERADAIGSMGGVNVVDHVAQDGRSTSDHLRCGHVETVTKNHCLPAC